MEAVHVLGDFVAIVLWMGAWAQLLGMPVAWLRLRRTTAWRNRPAGVRSMDLLARFLLGVTLVTVVWGWVVLAVGLLDSGLSDGAYVLILFGGPALFVPWWVLQQDVSGFSAMAEELREEREQKLAEDPRSG